MKNVRIIALLALVVVLSSCGITDSIKDAATIDLETDLYLNIEMTADEEGYSGTEYTFSNEAILKAASVEEFESFIDGISNIAFSEGTATFTGLAETDTIKTITITVQVGENEAFTVFTANNIVEEQSEDLENVETIEEQWKEDYKQELIFKMEGTRNFSTEDHDVVTASISIPSTVSYSLLD